MRGIIRALLAAAVVAVPMLLIAPKTAEAYRGWHYRPGAAYYHSYRPYDYRGHGYGPYRGYYHAPHRYDGYYHGWYRGPRAYYYGPGASVRVGPLGIDVY